MRNHSPKADFIVATTGQLTRNAQGDAVAVAYYQAERAYDALTLSWACACVASLFLRHPWLQTMILALSASAEYDDQGGSYRSVSSSVSNVTDVLDTTALLPEAVMREDLFDADLAADLLGEDIEDSAYDLYSAFSEAPYGYDDLDLNLSRAVLAPLLTGIPVSGTKAFLARFPEHACLLRSDPPAVLDCRLTCARDL